MMTKNIEAILSEKFFANIRQVNKKKNAKYS